MKWFNTEVCKTSIHRFESGRRLHLPREPGEVFCIAEAPEAEAIRRVPMKNGIPPAEIRKLAPESGHAIAMRAAGAPLA